jgi:drug/metabolite transporter (DMT)-like permease
MHSALLIAMLAGLGGMLGWGSADFFAKKAVDTVGPIKSLVWAHLFGTAILFVAFLARMLFHSSSGTGITMNASSWLALAFFGVLQMIVYWLAYMGFEKGQISVLNPVFASYSGLVALLSIVLFGATLHWLPGVALIIIFAGNLLLNLDFSSTRTKRLNITPGLAEVGSAAVLAAVWTLGWDKFVSGRDALASALLMYAFMTIAAIVLAWAMKVKFQDVPAPLKKIFLMMGLGEAVAYLAISWGYSSTNLTSVVAVISGAFSVPTLILAYLFLKERITKPQLGAIITIIIGIVLLSLT